MQILTEIARGRITDYGEMGATGFVPKIGPETKNVRAVEEMTSRILVSGEGDGSQDAILTRVKLRDPIPAIKELNAMTGAYPDDKAKKDAPLPVVFNIVFPSGPRVPPPKIKRITMDDAKISNAITGRTEANSSIPNDWPPR